MIFLEIANLSEERIERFHEKQSRRERSGLPCSKPDP
jgi:hypothetical protein